MHKEDAPSSSSRYESANMGLGDKARKEKILDLSLENAAKWTLGMTAVAAAGTALVSYRYKNFNRFTSISIKWAIPTMTFIGTFSFVYETTMQDAMRFPQKYGLEKHTEEIKHVPTKLPVYKRFLNYVYDHPFQMIAGMGIPLAAGILNQQMHNTHLTLSQKIMHSRVFAQGGVLTILLSTMAFREYMDRRGRFVDEEDEDQYKEEAH
mmetsp:Transcript_951/g.585  ORF Transcript_951/g.585 Transcript_951/m.585 type:complete len:208 (-) Transcript_951:196-819(-)|eukprot:CAMPEP_0202958894 /NCGR_PEP_ID=MMETSP1396-20130829/3166_1 /ASSEMBLY_ACC=CAM_ASM_000872 /TAXON_ID= /ORGANISM="Pseudokeronopsis sp., Strain Brazil" /LENGTH=207 /DNA_ID=CAMNT_0049677201 /DNA_START=65 /DNA_END=688 /DNA_ORIENTATION=-